MHVLFRTIASAMLVVLALAPWSSAQSPTVIIDQTTPYVDPVIPGPIVYSTPDEIGQIVNFEGTVRVTSVSFHYTSSVPINYTLRFYSASLVKTLVVPNLPSGGGLVEYTLPADQQFDWQPQVTVDVLRIRRSFGRYSVQISRTDGGPVVGAAAHVMATSNDGFWQNFTQNRVESGPSVGIATFDTNNDIAPPVGPSIRIAGERPTPIFIASASPSTTTIRGGQSFVATVTVTAPAPAGGLQIALASTSSALSVPTSVVIPQGATSATFQVRTNTVRRNTSAVVTLSLGTQTRSIAVTVTR